MFRLKDLSDLTIIQRTLAINADNAVRYPLIALQR